MCEVKVALMPMLINVAQSLAAVMFISKSLLKFHAVQLMIS